MLEKIDLGKKLSKKEYDAVIDDLSVTLSKLQRDAKNLNIPVVIVFEGFGAAGKGTMINQLLQPLDPRGFSVYSTGTTTEEESMRPYLWRFATKMSEKGRITIFDRSWYKGVMRDRIDGITTPEMLATAYDDIISFEKQHTDDGTLIIKFFLHISKKEEKKRFDKLEEVKSTAWRVTKDDWRRYKNYDEHLRITDEAIEKTDTSNCPWTVIEAIDKRYAFVKIISNVNARLTEAIELKKRQQTTPVVEEVAVTHNQYKSSVLEGIDLSKSLTKAEYTKRLKTAQDKLFNLHNALYKKRIPLILAFEGWDAGGKGGAIKRVTEKLDPRGYQVVTTAAPNDVERKHHYLWRFWNGIPKNGHIVIFDRTWYGRVMVERIEGFCSKDEWKRAYKEINDFEHHLTSEGAVVLKFWLHIDKEEQEARFKERTNNPEKQWKITDEDWRNREHWEDYKEAVDEMLLRTSTTYAPWIVVEANSKYYARIKILETIIEYIEKALKE